MSSPDWFSEHGYYTHVVIEKVKPGVTSYDKTPVWIELIKLEVPVVESYEDEEGNKETYTRESEAVKVSAPGWAKNIVCWGMG